MAVSTVYFSICPFPAKAQKGNHYFNSAARHYSETFVVVLVRANPFPEKDAASELANGAVVIPTRTDQLGLPIGLKCSEG